MARKRILEKNIQNYQYVSRCVIHVELVISYSWYIHMVISFGNVGNAMLFSCVYDTVVKLMTRHSMSMYDFKSEKSYIKMYNTS